MRELTKGEWIIYMTSTIGCALFLAGVLIYNFIRF